MIFISSVEEKVGKEEKRKDGKEIASE